MIREYIVQVTRLGVLLEPLQPEKVETQVRSLENLFQVADDTASVTAQLIQILKDTSTGGKQVHDANIVATMLVYDIDTLVSTNEEDMRRFVPQIKLITLAHTE